MNIPYRYPTISQTLANQRGVSAVITAIVIVALLGFTSLAVDVGYMYSTGNELQNIADAAALSAARELGKIYSQLPYTSQQTYNVNAAGDVAVIQQAAMDVATKNQAAGKVTKIKTEDIRIGVWNWEDSSLTPTPLSPDAVQVTMRRDNTENGPVTTFFAKVLDIFGGSHDTFSVVKTAAAALTGPAKMEEGELNTPFGLSQTLFEQSACPDKITFNPTTASCAGWHNFFDPISANDIVEKWYALILGSTDHFVTETGEELRNGPEWMSFYFPSFSSVASGTVTPETAIGESFEFTGGVASKVFVEGSGAIINWTGEHRNIANGYLPGQDNDKKPAPFFALFDFFRMRDGDGEDLTWTATVPVYHDSDPCTNPNQSLKIAGFATVVIKMPKGPPEKMIEVKVTCQFTVVEGRGGGGPYGNVRGTIPNLVL